MIGVTPLGIFTESPIESRRFYSEIMEIEKIHFVREIQANGWPKTLLKLESPQLEVFSVETKVVDKVSRRIICRRQSLIFNPPNFATFLERLKQEKIEPFRDGQGNCYFEDLNGLTWEVRIWDEARKSINCQTNSKN